MRRGVLCARGRLVLMADADGASRFAELERLRAALAECQAECGDPLRGVAVGSRAHLAEEAATRRSPLRQLAMHGFHLLVMLLGGIRTIRDTQVRSAQAVIACGSHTAVRLQAVWAAHGGAALCAAARRALGV